MKALWVVILVGCASDPKSMPMPTPMPMPLPSGCVTLAATEVAPASSTYSITTDTSVCLHVDASMLHRAAFGATLPYEAGTTSAFATVLQDTGGQVLVEGWNVTVGQSSPMTFEDLEWTAPAGVTTDVTLVVQAPAPTATTLSLSLFDPLD